MDVTRAERTADRRRAGEAALARGAWAEARAAFEAEVAEGGPSAEALEGLSWAAWWQADAPALFEAREAAYRLYRAAGDDLGAARMATWLGTDHVDFRGELAVANGWLARARRLLERHRQSPEFGQLCVHEAEKALYVDDTAAALRLAESAVEIGRRLRDVDVEILGRAVEGLALATEGRVADGMHRLDEAAAAALAGETRELWATSWCCCFVIYACERVHDYDRAAQWCRRAVAFAERNAIESFNRLCRAHHAGVLVWRGRWTEAEEELVAARERLEATRPPWAAEAVVRLGELRRRQGRPREAADLFAQADGHPLALVGRAELHLDDGDAPAAADALERFLREVPERSRTQRAPALEGLVRARAAQGDAGAAGRALAELEAVAEVVGSDPIRASAAVAAGVAAAAQGRLDAARRAFEDAARRYARAGAPYETGGARMRLAEVLAALGRERQAAAEAAAAADLLEGLGAARDAARARELAGRLAGRPPRPPISPREREVLALVAAGMSDRAIAEALVLSEHTVHRHVANILAKLGCPSRSAAVAEALRRELL